MTLVRLSGATQVAGGVALGSWLPAPAVGRGARGHADPADPGRPPVLGGARPGEARRNQRQHFLKGIGLLGGLLLAAVDTEGEPGLAWRARQASDDLQDSTRRVTKRARREAKLAARAAQQEARVLRAETKARIAA